MGDLIIRDLDEETVKSLRMRAAEHGHSMEEEARDILRCALFIEPARPTDLGSAIHRRFAAMGGVDLLPPRRDPIRRR